MAMNLIIPNYHQLSVQNRQLWINLPATGLVAILWALGVSSIQPAQASVSKQETTSFEPTQTHQQTNFPQSPTQAPEVLNSAFVATEGNNSLNLGQLTLGSEFGCINEKTCNPRIPKARSLELPTNSNQTLAQLPQLPQPLSSAPVPTTAMPMGVNGYNQGLGQYPNYPQTVLLMPMGANGYNQGLGQYPNYPQTFFLMPATAMPMGVNGYNQGLGQYPNYPQNQAPLPPPLTPNQMGTNGYNQGWIQYPNYPQNQAPLPITPNQVGTNGYNQGWIQYPNYPQNQAPLPVNPNPNFAQPLSTPTTNVGQIPPTQVPPEISSKPINSPSLSFQGSYITQGEDSVARARLSGIYPVTPQILFGATFDLTSEDNELADSPEDGFNINELYLAAAPFKDLPNLRFVVGQLDLTSYFDRNSFAKDGVSHFFNSVFQTNPALSATGIASRTGALVNWSVTDNIEAKAAVFSSDRALDDFDLDGFAGEIGLRFGNAIVRGTYATARDAGSDTGFQEIFSLSRGDNDFGLEPEDREESYGINAEVFIPNLNMGLFARYGRYENRELDEGADTYSLGLTFLDVFAKDDRLGLAYGRGLSNERLRQDNDDDLPDVLELFYDFRFLRNLRLGVTLQQRDNFSDTFAGFRIKTDFDLIRRRRGGQ
ncbi:MAG: hypothetical protein F6J89_26880 [Symploca sp. SIO1C4]|uniref:Porin n=1 Tax=Symploca sp. SIO1C4 TaxID=2607765 RepID=A0A6B3NHC9_9CYAN|nr:hypothetical protein [Symploca sp. SIO1C4]